MLFISHSDLRDWILTANLFLFAGEKNGVAQMVKNLPAVKETPVRSLGWEDGNGRREWRREWLPTLVFLPEEFYGQRSLVGYSPWGHKESDVTE